MIRDYNEGAHVMVDMECIEIMENANKSIHNYPGQSFIDQAKSVIGRTGIVTKRFKPGYEINVTWSFEDPEKIFGYKTIILQMKDHWVKPLDHNYKEVK